MVGVSGVLSGVALNHSRVVRGGGVGVGVVSTSLLHLSGGVGRGGQGGTVGPQGLATETMVAYATHNKQLTWYG